MLKAALLILIVLFILLASPVMAAVAMQSYSDSARTIQSDLFTEYNCYVYMKATGVSPATKTYTFNYYDAGNNWLMSASVQSSGGTVLSLIHPATYPTADAGTWRADLLNDKGSLIATDTFTVQQSAIPEFNNKLAALGVCGIVGVTYLGLRKKIKRTRR